MFIKEIKKDSQVGECPSFKTKIDFEKDPVSPTSKPKLYAKP
jgi:hypothetical protein